MRTYGPNRSRLWGFVILAVVSLVTVALFIALAMRSAADAPSTASGSTGSGTSTDSTPSATPSVTPTPTFTPAPIVVPAPSPTPEPATPTVAFLGDSYAAGVGATSATKRWTTLLSTALGWKEVNLARAGTGFVTNVTVNAQATCGLEYCATIADKAADAIALQPDIVVVSGGRFDANQPVADVKAALTSTLQRLAEGLPNAKLIVISPMWDATAPPNTILVMSDELATAANGANGTYIDIKQPLQGRSDRLVKGGVYANDSGQLAIERAVLAGLAKAGISK